MKVKNKSSISNQPHFDPHVQQNYLAQQSANRQVPSKVQKGYKVAGLNQSMDAGFQPFQANLGKFGAQQDYMGQSQPQQNYHVNMQYSSQQHGTKSGGQHMRSGSQIVNGNMKVKGGHHKSSSQYQEFHQPSVQGVGQYDLTPAQVAQLNYLTQNQARLQDQRVMTDQDAADAAERLQQQKMRRKNNLSHHIMQNNMPGGSMLLMDQHHDMNIQNQEHLAQSYSGPETNHPGSKREQSQKTKHAKHASVQQAPSSGQFEALRSNTNPQNLMQQNSMVVANSTLERFNTGTKGGSKKAKIAQNQNQIILPAGALMQGVPQLKQQLNGKHVSVTHSAHQGKPNLQMTSSLQNQNSHQRMQSLQDSNSVASNMARGFNSASNAAHALQQQQAQIMQIYQQSNVNNMISNSSTQSVKQKNNYQSNSNSRKIIPQINQVISHHKRANQHQISRDRDSKQLMVESFGNNYQTYNQTYGSNNQITMMTQKQNNSTDSTRMTRIHQNKEAVKDHSSMYNHTAGPQVLTIPQKKMKHTQSNKSQPNGQNQSMHNLAKNSTYSQHGVINFFENPQAMSTQNMTQAIMHSESSFDNRPHSKGGHTMTKNTSFTPQLPQSMKQTINNNFDNVSKQGLSVNEAALLKQTKSGHVSQQVHVRHTSVHVGEGSSHSKKMNIQHRKNKSMLNNQIRINPTLQQNGGSQPSNKVRQSHQNNDSKNLKQNPSQMYDNYADLATTNFYMQQPPPQKSNKTNSNFNISSNNSQQSLQGGKMSHTQSSHRKNKTSVIGNHSQKMTGINSSSAFYPVSNLPASLIASESQPSAAIKKIIGGTSSQSHKSLRSSSSSQRKRTGSNDAHAKHKKAEQSQYEDNARDRYHQASGQYHVDSAKHKTQKSYSSQVKGGLINKQIKPQGNIVIQQQNGQSTHEQNLINAKVNRRQSSILKGEHQNKQLIFIENEQNAAQKQQVAQRFGSSNNRPHPVSHHENKTPDGESVGSVSSIQANNLSFRDGGTGGGKIKAQHSNTRQSQLQRDSRSHQVNDHASYTEQKQKKYNSMSASNDYEAKTKTAAGLSSNLSGHSYKKFEHDIDNDEFQVADPRTQFKSKKATLVQSKPSNPRNAANGLNDLSMLGLDSINITREALALGKVPPENIADLLKASGYTMREDDAKLSPRTREMVGISNIIRRSFKSKGVAPKTTPDFYRAGKMLGRGAFGKVSLGMHKLSRKLVALKSINKEYMSDEKQKSKVMHEVGILLRLRHQSVVKLYETFETKRHMLLSMELCAGGDLLNYVRKRKKLDEDSAKIIFKQIIEGLGYIHRKRILHRDIKLDNILLDGKGNVKIADFGVSKLVKPGDVMHEQSGTPAYIAPEILREQGYTGFKADIWSAGVVLYAMLCGTVPFKASNMKELHKMIMKGKYHLKEEVTDEAKHLLKAMLDIDPKTRISVAKILEHPWLASLPADLPEIFNQEEKDIVKREFIYNNPKIPNRSEQVNADEEPWDCFTELNLDSINQTLRNESEKSVILAPFNSSLSDYNEEEYQGAEASLIIHRLFDDAAPLEDKKEMVRFAARCRDQDRQYEINNNGELDNGVYHKFVYSSRDGGPDPSSSLDGKGGSVSDLRPQSSRNANKPSADLKKEIAKRVKEGKLVESEATDDYGHEDSKESLLAPDALLLSLDQKRVQTLVKFGYPEEYVRYCISENESCYCMATYLLLGEDQRYA